MQKQYHLTVFIWFIQISRYIYSCLFFEGDIMTSNQLEYPQISFFVCVCVLFSGVWSLNANVSEHSVCSIFMGE
jgi:uncharacterized membrane protein YiaA